jgi:UrcA family protein
MLKSVRSSKPVSTRCALAAGIALAAAAAVPAFAQPVAETTAGEVVVTGRYHVGPNVRTLSAPVSYRDLDLTTAAGQNVLTQRVRAAARDLCRRLGEANMGRTLAQPSCEQDAMNSATGQERVAIAQATPRSYAANPPEPVAPAEAAPPPAAETYAQPAATVTTTTVTNGPVPDTPENRERFGGPNSHGGRRTAAAGN